MKRLHMLAGEVDSLLTCLLLAIGFASCATTPSWPDLPFEAAAENEDQENAAEALNRLRSKPSGEEEIIWYGRRLGYLGEYALAIETYSRGLRIHPKSAKLLRHRGHRHISLRQFDEAILDFEQAADLIEGKANEVEPDGKPNAQNIPTSTLHGNIWYHLGLAYYCKGEFAQSLTCYQQGLQAAQNLDSEVATRYWIYHCATRLGDSKLARSTIEAVRSDWPIIENHSYHDLLLLYRGDLALANLAGKGEDPILSATLEYGMARHELTHGAEAAGKQRLRALAETGSSAFGCIAAEADLKRR